MNRQFTGKMNRQRGFSIIELLVAVIIIGILASILIPIVANRSDQARKARAVSDLERIGDALERASIDTGYYPRLFMLDDTGGADANTGEAFQRSSDPTDKYINSIVNYETSGWHLNTDRLFLDPATGDLVPASQGSLLRQLMVDNETEFNWNGPYITFQDDENHFTSDAANVVLPDQIPDDPWGNNYLLFTRKGLMLEGPPDGGQVITTNYFLPPHTNGAISVPVDVFDRLTIVSLGPNGLPGNGVGSELGTGDDIVRQVGR